MVACRGGKVSGIVAVAVLASEGLTGASTVIRRIDDPAMERAAALLAERLGLSGFYGFDFMIEASTRIPYLIEMNPRCTQLGHLRFGGNPSVAEAFAADLRGKPQSTSDPLPLDKIALFPQALNETGASHAAYGSYLDVPWDEPRLVAELCKGPWPERRWLSRLYHAVRPMERSTSVEYSECGYSGARTTSPLRLVAMRGAADAEGADPR
jgi:hypothetical protein